MKIEIKKNITVVLAMMLSMITSSAVYGASFGTGTTVTNNAPAFTAGPSDGGSSATSPTNVGNDVVFTATASDSNGDQYYLAICKTNSITPANNSAPSCDSGQTWTISSATNSGNQAQTLYTVQMSDPEANPWYAFICDHNPAGMCSSSSQATGDNGSPFVVNQVGTFGIVNVTDLSGGTIEPGETMEFKIPVGQIESSVNVNMYICNSATTGFDYILDACTGTGAAMICSDLNADPTTEDALCQGGTGLISVPTAHGNYAYNVYVEDQFNGVLDGTNSQTYAVTDVAPTLVSYTATDIPNVAAGGYDTIDYSAVIYDPNGDNDVTAVDGVFFDSAAVANNCTQSDLNCYLTASCTLSASTPGTGKTATGTDPNLTASCSAQMWFDANASTDWEVHVNPTDGLGRVTGFTDTNVNITNPELAGIDIVQPNITYGTLELGSVSSKQETQMANMGNQAFDIMVDGDTMCTDYPLCSGYTLSYVQQKWYHTDTDFNWNSAPAAAGPYTLVDTATGTDDETGCLNLDVAVRPAHDSTSTNESIWWKIKIPETQPLGTYTGENTFTSTAPSTCTNAQPY